MDRKQLHRIIIKRMGIKRNIDNLPYGSGRGYDRYTLARLLGEVKYNIGAEVGVRRGRFSKYLCSANPDLHLFCVDPWSAYSNKYTQERQDAIFAVYQDYTKGCNITTVRKASMDALADFEDNSLDFVFIDGNHQYDFVAPDIIEWSKKVKQNGIVMVHDYYAFGWSGVVQAVNGYTFCHDIRPWFVTKELEPTAYWVKP